MAPVVRALTRVVRSCKSRSEWMLRWRLVLGISILFLIFGPCSPLWPGLVGQRVLHFTLRSGFIGRMVFLLEAWILPSFCLLGVLGVVDTWSHMSLIGRGLLLGFSARISFNFYEG